MDDPCVIAGQIFPPHAAGLQPLTIGQIVDIRGYSHNIQSSSFEGSQSSQQAPIIETGVTMSPDEEYDNDSDHEQHIGMASNIPQPQPRIENMITTTPTPTFNPSAGCIPSPHPSSTNSTDKTTDKPKTESVTPEVIELPNSPKNESNRNNNLHEDSGDLIIDFSE